MGRVGGFSRSHQACAQLALLLPWVLLLFPKAHVFLKYSLGPRHLVAMPVDNQAMRPLSRPALLCSWPQRIMGSGQER